MRASIGIAVLLALEPASSLLAEEFYGFADSGRFCGYSAIIELRSGERIIPTQGGMHGGRFEWHGTFGKLEVVNIGWAAIPTDEPMSSRTGTGQTQFPEVEADGRFSKQIWDRAHGTAVFISDSPLTQAQLEAIDRVGLFTEGEKPENCKYSTVFAGFEVVE